MGRLIIGLPILLLKVIQLHEKKRLKPKQTHYNSRLTDEQSPIVVEDYMLNFASFSLNRLCTVGEDEFPIILAKVQKSFFYHFIL
jgi:hypothetical protein